MNNYKLVLNYNGSNFFGFQTQINKRTVEDELKLALRSLYKCHVDLVSCGRTDSGVHAVGHVVSFKVTKKYDTNNIKNALNYFLPNDIFISSIISVPNDFHARFSAKSREYRYLFTNLEIPLHLLNNVTEFKYSIDESKFDLISKSLLGKRILLILEM